MAYPFEDVIGNYTSDSAKYILSGNDADAEVIEKINSLYAAYLRISASHRVVDKYPEMVFRIEFLENLFAQNTYICLVRDGRDTMQSIQTWSEKHGQLRDENLENWWGKNMRKWKLLVEQVVPMDPALCEIQTQVKRITDPFDMAAVEWITAMNAALKYSRELPDRCLLVHYEKLLNNPTDLMEEIFSFCNLKYDRKCIEFANQTLRAGAQKESIDPSPLIKPAFDRTMQALGYKE